MADIPPRNCLFSVQNYGAVQVNAVRITHGISIISTTAGARHHRAMLPWKQTSGSCQVTIKHSSRADYANFNEWMKVYVDTISDPDGRLGTMRIYCPAAKFDRMCIPKSGIKFGLTHGEFVWTQTIAFIGASDPVDIFDVSAPISYGSGATRYTGDSSYPSDNFSIALGGLANLNNPGGTLEDSLYNSTRGANTIPGGNQSINNAGQSFG